MKFENIKNNLLFTVFGETQIEDLNAIYGGFKCQTDGNQSSISAGGDGKDCWDSATQEATDDGWC